MDFVHILGQKEAIWNTIFSIFERLRAPPPNVAGPGKTFPPFPPLDAPEHRGCTRNGTPQILAGIGVTISTHMYKGCSVNVVVGRGALNLQDRKMTDKSAGLENAGLESDGQICRGGKCRTGN